jgi:alkanesulfonate monooxygenase SsuD/methylene tetrahydromethanopterin reductase-like flavin-dependent oxidoreductase (luciferase family)
MNSSDETRPRVSRLQFGVSLPPVVQPFSAHLELAGAAEAVGLDLIGIQDHPYQPRYVDTLALIGLLLARTDRIRFFPDVANLPLRPPAVLAKTAATLDLLSEGRFELGLGAGGYWQAISTLGVDRLSGRESVDALEEAVGVIRAMWRDERGVELPGVRYSLHGASTGPGPAHEVGIWLGAQSSRMLTLTGRLADGWAAPIPSYLPYEDWAEAQERIDAAARQAGRSPAHVRRIAQVVGTVTAEPGAPWQPIGAEPIRGSAEQWTEVIRFLTSELRFDTVVFWPEHASVGQIERFGRDVAAKALNGGSATNLSNQQGVSNV